MPRLTLGDRLRLAREHAHIGSTEMAKHLKCSRHTITNAERGRTTPNHATILEWARLTKYDVAWLMDGQIEADDVVTPINNSAGMSREQLAQLLVAQLLGGESQQRGGYDTPLAFLGLASLEEINERAHNDDRTLIKVPA